MRGIRAALVFALPLLLAGCMSDCRSSGDPADAVLVALPEPERPPEPKKNMVWIPQGGFVSGTPRDAVPRLADVEMAGVQVTLHGFYIDQYPHPNEPGAIQTTNVSQEEAKKKCEDQGKRLCSELEWERACKGSQSTVYPYGNGYRSDDCGSSAAGLLTPTGTRALCKSPFDVYDLFGGAFEWTASDWARGTSGQLLAVKGGGGEPGDVFGRCANTLARRPRSGYPDVGFRCCAGEPNEAQVMLDIVRSPESFRAAERDDAWMDTLESALPEDLLALQRSGPGFRIDRHWMWYPIGNEELIVAAGCAHSAPRAHCGAVVYRVRGSKPLALAFAPSGWWMPNIQTDEDPRVLWVYGGDGTGKYRRRLAYLWGRIGVSDPERAAQIRAKKKKKRGN